MKLCAIVVTHDASAGLPHAWSVRLLGFGRVVLTGGHSRSDAVRRAVQLFRRCREV